jgi:two-component system sporulation sensor kinase C
MKSITKNRRKTASRQKKNPVTRKEPGGKYRVMLENATQGIIVLQDGRLQYANARARNFFGKPIEGLTPEALVNMVHPDDRSMVLGRHSQRLRGEEVPAVYPFRMVAADGQVRWVEISVSLIEWERRPAVLALVGDITGQKQAAEALKENELRYRLLAENATDVIWTTDLNLHLTYVSPGVTRLRGYTAEEVMAESLERAYAPDSWPLIQKVYAEELAEEKRDGKDLARTRTLELQHRCKDGSFVWGETKISAIRDAEGKIVEILGVTRDITARKKAEEAARRLAEEEAVMAEISRIMSSSLNIEEVYWRFAGEVRKLIEFENLNINLINPEETFMVVTHVSGKPIPGREVGTIIPLVGTAVGEVLKTRSSLLVHKENLEETVRKFPKVRVAVECGRQSVIIAPLMREDQVFGTIHIFSSRPDAYTRADVGIAEKVASQIAGAIANARLFQELQRAVEALKESELRNRSLVEAAGFSGLGIVVFKEDEGRNVFCLFANEEAQKITGYSAEELGRIPFREIIYPAHRELALSRYWTHAAGEKEPVLYHLIIRHKKGHTVLIEVSAIHSFFHGEDCMIGFFRDISERKRVEKELADYRAHLERMVEERTARIHELEQQRGEIEKMAATGVLAARIAHEINNPLAGIKGSFMLIQDAIPPDHPYHHYVERIHGEINRIARVVRQMFELYRSPEDDTEEWGMDQMIQDVVALLKDEARARKVFFQLPVLPVQVRIPAGPIRQVLFNVIKNAVEASPVEGRVRVSFQGGEKEISIQVADEGPGISEKNRPHVFKPFFSTKKGRQKGLGLGLSISKEIVESLGGSIRLQNSRGKGLLCQIDLPKRNRMKENVDD